MAWENILRLMGKGVNFVATESPEPQIFLHLSEEICYAAEWLFIVWIVVLS